MKTISIGKAFSAMLWVIEKEQNVPENEMLGAWNFYDLKSQLKPINYIRLVNTLGHDYFQGSLYQGVSDSINLTNAVDGGILLTPENELVCRSRDESNPFGQAYEEWLSYEADVAIFRDAHTDRYPKDKVFTVSRKTDVSTSLDNLSVEDKEILDAVNNITPEKIAKIKNKKLSEY
ncbi:MAG: hypothetical protein MJK15_08205 [Colwellia sp.]|nr:hypothetical protein [Colwellia sp.]